MLSKTDKSIQVSTLKESRLVSFKIILLKIVKFDKSYKAKVLRSINNYDKILKKKNL